jgi:uncharacterized membrane protein
MEVIVATATRSNVSQQEPASPHSQAQWDPQQNNERDVISASNERAAYLVGGSLLTLFGLRRRSTFGALLAIVGGSLIYKGMMIGAEQR